MVARRAHRRTLLALFLLLTACRPPGQSAVSPAAGGTIVGVEPEQLTGEEKRLLDSLLSDLKAPCAPTVSLGDCARSGQCPACAPAARALFAGVRLGRLDEELRSEYLDRFAPDKVLKVEADNSPVEGAPNASVTIIEWADYQCPHCAHATRLLDKLLLAHPNDLRVVFKHFPLPMHPQAELAARATIAAGEQNAFWKLHRKLFETQELTPDEGRLQQLATELGLDWVRLQADMRSAKTDERLSRDRQQAEALKVRGTPAIFVNGRAFDLRTYELETDLPAWVATEVELTRSTASGAKP
jgi:protein-disulfide isomerase